MPARNLLRVCTLQNHNLGGNALHGDSSVEWVPMSSGRWAWAGAGYFNVSDQ
jgi:hypothetical protein